MNRTRQPATQQPRELPWWLGGDESCEFCLQQYDIELEYRCVECDHPICPMCVVTIRETRRVLCPQCSES